MPLLKGNQIAAARALLGWDQKHVAERIGVTAAAISKIEKGENTGRSETLGNIERVFVNAGLEFTSGDGVKKRENPITIYKERAGFLDFMNDVYETARDVGGEIYVSNVNENDFELWLGDQDEKYTKRMASIQKNFDFKILIEQDDTNFSAGPYAEYRWVDKKYFSSTPFYIYADKVAFIHFDIETVQVFKIENKGLANAQRNQFKIAWDSADIPIIKEA